MTLQTWLILFILSMAVNAEVLAWAVRHHQFSHVNRGRAMALRSQPLPGPAPRRRPRALAVYVIALVIMTAVWSLGMGTILHLAFPHLKF